MINEKVNNNYLKSPSPELSHSVSKSKNSSKLKLQNMNAINELHLPTDAINSNSNTNSAHTAFRNNAQIGPNVNHSMKNKPIS